MTAEGTAKRYSGGLLGLRWEAEACPDASGRDAIKPAAAGGLLGFGLSFFFGASSSGRLLMAALGAVTGAAASRYHFNADWDPDRLRGMPETPDSPDDAPDVEA